MGAIMLEAPNAKRFPNCSNASLGVISSHVEGTAPIARLIESTMPSRSFSV